MLNPSGAIRPSGATSSGAATGAAWGLIVISHTTLTISLLASAFRTGLSTSRTPVASVLRVGDLVLVNRMAHLQKPPRSPHGCSSHGGQRRSPAPPRSHLLTRGRPWPSSTSGRGVEGQSREGQARNAAGQSREGQARYRNHKMKLTLILLLLLIRLLVLLCLVVLLQLPHMSPQVSHILPRGRLHLLLLLQPLPPPPCLPLLILLLLLIFLAVFFLPLPPAARDAQSSYRQELLVFGSELMQPLRHRSFRPIL